MKLERDDNEMISILWEDRMWIELRNLPRVEQNRVYAQLKCERYHEARVTFYLNMKEMRDERLEEWSMTDDACTYEAFRF